MSKIAVRPVRIVGDAAFVTLTRGYEAIIDAADVPLVNRANWYTGGLSRGVLYARSTSSARKCIHMHRLIANAPAGFDVDHIDGNGLNNRRGNLRLATRQQNTFNQFSCNPLGAKGVKRMGNRYQAKVTLDGAEYYLGMYSTVEEAAAAYRGAALILHGPYASTRVRLKAAP